MSLTPGTRIGAYEVVASLGAGGMGEVYRARDTRLKRDVALKILPEAFAADPERVARFQREAEVLGALNHPLIAHVYGIEEAPIGGGGTYRAIAMELVEGEDLAARLAHGALPIDEAIPIARQIAEALEAAHDQGIIHRDLKPANIKLRPDGTVKVLDFGLAKALDTASSAASTASASAGLLNSPTITTPAMTLQGMILGTAAYMSPEQAKGRSADKRSDLWAFGCVLFEMLTGRRPFDGEDVSDTLALVLKGSPDWSALPAYTPPAIRTLIQRCLERDRGRRVASASTALYALSDASLADERSAAPSSDPKAIRTAVDAAVAATRRQMTKRRVVPLAAAAVLGLGLAAALAWTRAAPPPAPVIRLVVDRPPTTATGRQTIALSPDGQHLAWVTSFRLFIRPLGEYDVKEIAGSENFAGINHPVFSPDGRSIAYFSAGALRRVSLAGGAPTTLCSIEPPFGISWHDTGIVVGQGNKGIVRCSASGGAPEQLLTVAEGLEAHGPQLLSGGTTLMYSLARMTEGRARWDKAQVIAESVGGGNRRVLVDGGSDARYVATGHLLYALSGVIFAVPFDATRVEVTGQAVPVIEGVSRALTGVTGSAQFDTSSNGTLVYLPGPARTSTRRLIAASDRGGNVSRLSPAAGSYEHVRVSPDGHRLVIGSEDENEAIVWIYPLDGKGPMQRLPLRGRNIAPVWAPDGRRLALQSDVEKDRAIFTVREDGTGLERLTKPGPNETHTPESWSPDGHFISFSAERNGRYALRTVAVETKAEASFAGIESEEAINSVFSPDGKWIAYTIGVRGAIQTTTRGVYVQPFPATGAVFQLPKQGLDFHPAWTRDGREIVWVPSASIGMHAVVPVTTAPALKFGAPSTFPARVARQTSGQFRLFDLMPDGRIVGTIDPAETGTLDPQGDLRIVLNWFEELKRNVPAR